MDVLTSLTPHGFCLAWQPRLLATHAVADLLIAVAYYSIPLALLVLVRRRRDLAFPWVFRLFALFIVGCGTTHVMAVVTLWEPLYWLDAIIKAGTAVVSVITAAVLWPLIPKALALPSPAALRASEERQRAMYRGTPAPLHTLDLDARLLEVSDAWIDLLGYRREEVLGRPIETLHSGEPAHTFADDWDRLLKYGMVRDVERRLRCKDGTVRDVLISATLERGVGMTPDGTGGRIMAAVTDVTARRQAEAALRDSEERLRQSQKMEAVGQLTGGIAHDFNNMLTAVMGSLELLQRRVGDDPGVTRLIDGAMAASTRAARLTSQLLSFSRMQRLEPQPLRPVAVIEDMRDLLERTVGEAITLRVASPEPELICVVDRNQLESVLLNLVLNARAAIDGPGEVGIAVWSRRLDADGAAGTAIGRDDEPLPPGDYVVIDVADTGHGMTDEVRRRAIEPFFTTKGVGQGTGLGLSQSYGFLRQSGGTLLIESEPGRGTRVQLLLPRTVAAAQPAPAPAEPMLGGAKAGRGEHVLVVEDEARLLTLVAAALREDGYRVTGAEDGATALRLLASDPSIRMLFADVALPGHVDGVALAREAARLRPGLPVLLATGYGERASLAGWPAGVVVLAKPYAMAELAGHVAAALRGARPSHLAAE